MYISAFWFAERPRSEFKSAEQEEKQSRNKPRLVNAEINRRYEKCERQKSRRYTGCLFHRDDLVLIFIDALTDQLISAPAAVFIICVIRCAMYSIYDLGNAVSPEPKYMSIRRSTCSAW